MKKLILLFAVLLWGCAGLQPTPLPTAKPLDQMTPKEKAQFAIDEANLEIAAAAITVGQDFTNGFLTQEQYSSLGTTLAGYARQLNQAQTLLDAGDLAAGNQASVVKGFVVEFRKQLASKRKKPAFFAPDPVFIMQWSV